MLKKVWIFSPLCNCHLKTNKTYLEEEVFCYISLQDFQCNLASNHSEVSGSVHYRPHLYHKALGMGQYIFDFDKPWFVDNLDFGYILDDKPKMDLQNNQEYRNRWLLYQYCCVFHNWHCLHKGLVNRDQLLGLKLDKYLFKNLIFINKSYYYWLNVYHTGAFTCVCQMWKWYFIFFLK